jgi:hypothetical protein
VIDVPSLAGIVAGYLTLGLVTTKFVRWVAEAPPSGCDQSYVMAMGAIVLFWPAFLLVTLVLLVLYTLGRVVTPKQ